MTRSTKLIILKNTKDNILKQIDSMKDIAAVELGYDNFNHMERINANQNNKQFWNDFRNLFHDNHELKLLKETLESRLSSTRSKMFHLKKQ
tara:strand:- start:174 stop:446 length:273 start_codon:yes stop_codon:yes gene_type:complete